jgi:hypothetical protein
MYHQPKVLLAGWLDDAIEVDHRGEKREDMSKPLFRITFAREVSLVHSLSEEEQ